MNLYVRVGENDYTQIDLKKVKELLSEMEDVINLNDDEKFIVSTVSKIRDEIEKELKNYEEKEID